MASIAVGYKSFILLILAAYCRTSFSDNVEKSGRENLVSFQPLGKQVMLGLDILVPFLTVPTGKKHSGNGNHKALINIDASSLIISGLITSGGIALSQLFQTLDLQTTTTDYMMSEGSFSRNVGTQLRNIFYPIPKLVFTNSTGQQVETTLSFANIDQFLLENDFDLLACIQKSICSMVHEAGDLLKAHKAVGIHKIVDGLAHIKWLLKALQNTALLEAIVAGKFGSSNHCDLKYPRCQWPGPHKTLLELLNTFSSFFFGTVDISPTKTSSNYTWINGLFALACFMGCYHTVTK